MICNKRTVLFFRHEKDYSFTFTLLFPEGKLKSLPPTHPTPTPPTLSLLLSLPSPPFPSFIEIDSGYTVVGYVLTVQNSIFHTVMLVEVFFK